MSTATVIGLANPVKRAAGPVTIAAIIIISPAIPVTAVLAAVTALPVDTPGGHYTWKFLRECRYLNNDK
jgi:hypothetical protein